MLTRDRDDASKTLDWYVEPSPKGTNRLPKVVDRPDSFAVQKKVITELNEVLNNPEMSRLVAKEAFFENRRLEEQ